MHGWSNLAKVIFKRTYARPLSGRKESWEETYERTIIGNTRGFDVSEDEISRLKYFMSQRKAGPAGRGWWFSGTPSHARLGELANVNCWYVTADDWDNFVVAQNLLMLGGGVGMSVEHRYVSKLPRIKRGVKVVYRNTKDADFIVPDSREGWCELTRRVLESFFSSGKSFSFSTVCVRGANEPIRGFGGTSSGPKPLVEFVAKVSALLTSREGKTVRPIDAADLICAVGQMVKMGNVRRSAIMVLGDPWDKDFLRAKRWDLAPIPSQRSTANFSVVCDDIEDLHPKFWETYYHGEAFGLVNRAGIRKWGRVGEKKRDTADGTNPCAEACLEPYEPCNLQEIALPNLSGPDEFFEAAVLMHRWGKRVTCGDYGDERIARVVQRNRRIGTGITGCLQSPLFTPEILDHAYGLIQAENERYSQELQINPSIRTTTIKPSGTMSKLLDVPGEGIHPAYSAFFVQRIRFGADDPLIPLLRAAGHNIEPEIQLDGGIDASTLVVDFLVQAPEGVPVTQKASGEIGFSVWDQLAAVLMAQKHWSDQSISVTAYYRNDPANPQDSEVPQIKKWLEENWDGLKTASFMQWADHGFKQAPKEAISEEEYEKRQAQVRDLSGDELDSVGDGLLDDLECARGSCPAR